MSKWYYDLITALKKVENVTVNRVRKSRPKSPEQLIKKLNYRQDEPSLKIESIHPKKIIGSNILYCYNVKTKKLIVYQSKEGYTLSVKGSTLENVDFDRSYGKTLRKPEVQLQEFLNRGKKPMLDYLNNIKSKNSPVTGRINADTVLLKTF